MPILPPGRHDTQQLARDLLVVGREHRPEGREDHVERRVRERQCFGIGLLEGEGQPFSRRALAGLVEQRRDVVGGGHVGEATGGGEGGVAAAGGNIQHPLTAAEVDRLAQQFGGEQDGVADPGIVSG